jgi:hypothetical protein
VLIHLSQEGRPAGERRAKEKGAPFTARLHDAVRRPNIQLLYCDSERMAYTQYIRVAQIVNCCKC